GKRRSPLTVVAEADVDGGLRHRERVAGVEVEVVGAVRAEAFAEDLRERLRRGLPERENAVARPEGARQAVRAAEAEAVLQVVRAAGALENHARVDVGGVLRPEVQALAERAVRRAGYEIAAGVLAHSAFRRQQEAGVVVSVFS